MHHLRASSASLNTFLSRFVVPARLARLNTALARRTQRVCLVLDSIADPHNAAACLRTADGMGLQHVHIVNNTGRAFGINHTVSKATEQWLTLHQHTSADACIGSLRAQGYMLWATSLHPNAVSMDRVATPSHSRQNPSYVIPDTQKLAIVFGNEHSGVGEEFLKGADTHVTLPMAGFAQSFNISVSVGMALAYCHQLGLLEGDLGHEEKETLLTKWLHLSIGPTADHLITRWGVEQVRRSEEERGAHNKDGKQSQEG
eukprot:TRINITY_DN13848_c0_g1_i1.p1 TRINITY_DN13848_c0_g1~~TRINITY_DN13848_c0_g1_i1.p1  ORF type:complete len:258 (-),score=48.55 TRINITY_DN13848_c0_g1_i1:74-847(-)